MIRGDHLIKWDRQTKETKLYKPDSYPSSPYGIDVDSKDNIWVVLSAGAPRIGRFDPRTEKWTEYPAPTKYGRIQRLTGKTLSGTAVSRAERSDGWILQPARLPRSRLRKSIRSPYDIQQDAENNMWISDDGQGGTLIKYEPNNGTFTYYPSPQVIDMPKIEITREGAIWYCPRSFAEPGVGVLYPDVTKITTLGGYYRGYDPTSSKVRGEERVNSKVVADEISVEDAHVRAVQTLSR